MAETPVSVGELFEVTFYTWGNGQVGINVLHYRVGALGSVTNLTWEGLARQLAADAAPIYKDLIPSLYQYRGLSYRVRSPSGVWSATYYNTDGQGVSTSGENAAPNQVCGLISKRTAAPGRRGRGRMYVPFPTVNDIDTAEVPNAIYVALMTDLGNVLLTSGFKVDPLDPTADAFIDAVIYHRALATYDVITSFVAKDKWATQRRRGDYGKTNAMPL